MFEGQKPISWAARVALRRICKKCGERIDKPPGLLRWLVGKPQNLAVQAEEGRGACVAAETKQRDSQVTVDIPADEADESQDGAPIVVVEPGHEADASRGDVPAMVVAGSVSSQAEQAPADTSEVSSLGTLDMAVSLDIKAHRVKVAIPIQGEDSGSAEAEPETQTVCVDSVGEIEEVSFDTVGLSSQLSTRMDRGGERAPDPNARNRTAAGRREPRVDRIHQYVHKFEQYKKVMTLHYTDENNVRHTESLFMELEDPSPDFPKHAEASEAHPMHTRGAAKSEVLVDTADDEAGTQVEEPDHPDVVEELKQLLEEKVLKPQREFDKQYQKVHQKRLKINKQTELLEDTGHYSLQVISYSEDLPSPVLSRSSSIRNVSLEDESNLIRSASEASSLADDIRALRDKLRKRRGSLKEKKENSRAWGNLAAASRQYGSLQALPTPFSPALVKSQSDTSGIDYALRKMRKQDSSASDGQTLARWRGSEIFQGKTSAIETQRNICLPLSVTDSIRTATENKSSASTTSTISSLPNIPDVLTPSSSSDSEPEEKAHQFTSAAALVSHVPSTAGKSQQQDKTSKLSTTKSMEVMDNSPSSLTTRKPGKSQLQEKEGKPHAAGDGQTQNGKSETSACALVLPSSQQRLVRSHSIRKLKTELSNLRSSLKDLKSEDKHEEEKNQAHDAGASDRTETKSGHCELEEVKNHAH